MSTNVDNGEQWCAHANFGNLTGTNGSLKFRTVAWAIAGGILRKSNDKQYIMTNSGADVYGPKLRQRIAA